MTDFFAALSDPPIEHEEDLPADFGALPPATAGPLDLAPVKAGLSKYDQAIADMEAQAQAIVITDETLAQANELGALASKTIKAIEKAQKDATGPAWEFKSTVDRLAKGYKDRFESIKKVCAGKIANFQEAKRLERAKAEEAARKAKEEAQAKLDAQVAAENEKRRKEAEATGQKAVEVPPIVLATPVIPEEPKVVRTEAGSSHQVKTWTFKVVDPAQVPREFLTVDESAIRRAVKDGMRNIAGVEIYEETQTRFRA